ncbi:hypothetical protein OWV82_006853 [Melia azedarach]|uniref:Uncharacterized protein n=1 Tax=Melia azedarach TaxID=155640 RepID=A0ACC1YII0_MELAZ|nr:hypothetical protein OWV82_006853 [Melia azedarach]
MISRYHHEYQHGSSSSSSSSSFHAPQTHMEPSGGTLLLLNSMELEIARSRPEMFSEYSLLCNGNRLDHCYKTWSSLACQCGFCIFEGKYGLQFQHFKEWFDQQNLQEDGRFLVTTAKMGTNLIPLCSSQEEDVNIAVPSIWGLNNVGQHGPIPLIRGAVSLRYYADNNAGISLFQDNHNHQQISPPLLMRGQAAASVRCRERTSSQGFIVAPAASPASSSNTVPSLPLMSHFINQSASSRHHNFDQSVVEIPAADDDYHTIHYSREDEESQPSNQTRLVETFIMMAVQTASVVGTSSNSESSTSNLSHNAKILSYFCIACNITGFIMFLYRMFLFGHSHGRAARIIRGLGYTFTAFGFMAVAAIRLHDNINFWITTASCVIAFPALARSFVD